MRASMYGASGISTVACTLATATHVHLHDDQCTCINSGRLQGDIRLTKLAALRGAKKSGCERDVDGLVSDALSVVVHGGFPVVT